MDPDSLGHGLGPPVEDVPRQDPADQSELLLLPAEGVQGGHGLLVAPESCVVLPLLDLGPGGGSEGGVRGAVVPPARGPTEQPLALVPRPFIL